MATTPPIISEERQNELIELFSSDYDKFKAEMHGLLTSNCHAFRMPELGSSGTSGIQIDEKTFIKHMAPHMSSDLSSKVFRLFERDDNNVTTIVRVNRFLSRKKRASIQKVEKRIETEEDLYLLLRDSELGFFDPSVAIHDAHCTFDQFREWVHSKTKHISDDLIAQAFKIIDFKGQNYIDGYEYAKWKNSWRFKSRRELPGMEKGSKDSVESFGEEEEDLDLQRDGMTSFEYRELHSNEKQYLSAHELEIVDEIEKERMLKERILKYGRNTPWWVYLLIGVAATYVVYKIMSNPDKEDKQDL